MSPSHSTWTTTGPPASRAPVATIRSAPDAVPGGRLLTIREIAGACQLSEKAVRRAIDDGELIAVKLRSRLRVTPADFDAWITAQRQQRSPAPPASPPPRLARRAPAGTFRALAQAAPEHGPSR